MSSTRTVNIERNVIPHAPGSAEVTFGNTRVICVATIAEEVPSWLKGSGRGWVTAEYSMLPGSTRTRCMRERRGAKGRTSEIERLIGRSLRACVDLDRLGGEVTVTVDCDVLVADGGTRTAAITGAYVALYDALRFWKTAAKINALPINGQVAAVSVGLVGAETVTDLDFGQDSRAEVDMNVVMDDQGRYIEIQGTAEQAPFTDEQLADMLAAARTAIDELLATQREVLEI
ncbi:MAG: ribonuclease PH [Actinomycetia bacterium]|nr:ribonuclease PH [Actinomycetes bacterium]